MKRIDGKKAAGRVVEYLGRDEVSPAALERGLKSGEYVQLHRKFFTCPHCQKQTVHFSPMDTIWTLRLGHFLVLTASRSVNGVR